jgi:tRNA pseudouridine32 synthase/23S rRNA pseudouridine746 synthase
MTKGAVTMRRGKKQRRLRRATTLLQPGDRLQLNYDAAILAQQPLPVVCIADEKAYSVWNKPAGMLAQGTVWGDHCALLRRVEQYFQPPREVFLVHRLDREAAGLMLIAHNKQAAAKLSQLFQTNNVYKAYRAGVKGCPAVAGESAVIDFPLDGKAAHSEYRVISYDEKADNAQLEVVIRSGRKHQIRRHLEAIGYPVMGDPRYGHDNKTTNGLQLVATRLEFECPLSGRQRNYLLQSEI